MDRLDNDPNVVGCKLEYCLLRSKIPGRSPESATFEGVAQLVEQRTFNP